jgi:hypothetical protein
MALPAVKTHLYNSNIFTSHPELFSPEVMANKQQILLDGTEDRLTTEIASAISALWGDESVQDALSASVMDASLAYYLESLDRLSAPEYIPTAADILRVASRERPPIEQLSLISPTSIPRSVVCVRHSRDGIRKWLHCFEGYSLIFMVNLDHYDELVSSPCPAFLYVVRYTSLGTHAGIDGVLRIRQQFQVVLEQKPCLVSAHASVSNS